MKINRELGTLLDLAKTRKLTFDELARLVVLLPPCDIQHGDGAPLLGVMKVFHDLISKYTTLRKVGENYLGLCPFHDEVVPSFSFSPKNRLFHCFGCGAHGGFVELAEYDKARDKICKPNLPDDGVLK